MRTHYSLMYRHILSSKAVLISQSLFAEKKDEDGDIRSTKISFLQNSVQCNKRQNTKRSMFISRKYSDAWPNFRDSVTINGTVVP